MANGDRLHRVSVTHLVKEAAKRAGISEKTSAKCDRTQRRKILALAQTRKISAVLVAACWVITWLKSLPFANTFLIIPSSAIIKATVNFQELWIEVMRHP